MIFKNNIFLFFLVIISLVQSNSRVAFSRPGDMMRIPNIDDFQYKNLFTINASTEILSSSQNSSALSINSNNKAGYKYGVSFVKTFEPLNSIELGLHIQKKVNQAKYVSVVKGKIYDVVVDLRKKSKTFGKCFTIILSQKNSKSLYIPKGFAHGFMGMDKENYVVYGNSNYRSKKNELGIMWNDKDLGINWPARRPLVSKKDRNNLAFKEFCKRHIKN